MRELKFKGWDTLFNTIVVPEKIGLDESRNLYCYCAQMSKVRYIPRDNTQVQLLMYLGIQDLNGIDVCEGDIIDFGENCYGAIHYKDAEWKYTFYSQGEKASNDLSLSDWIEKGVLTKPVVGNIYSHQYLLQ